MTTTKTDQPMTISTKADRPPIARTLGLRALSVLGAVAAALAVWIVAVPLAGAELAVRLGGTTQQVGPGAVVTTALLAGMTGWALFAAMERLLRRPRRAWTVVAIVALVLSLAGPLANSAGTATAIALAGMHLAVGAALIPVMRRSACRC